MAVRRCRSRPRLAMAGPAVGHTLCRQPVACLDAATPGAAPAVARAGVCLAGGWERCSQRCCAVRRRTAWMGAATVDFRAVGGLCDDADGVDGVPAAAL